MDTLSRSSHCSEEVGVTGMMGPKTVGMRDRVAFGAATHDLPRLEGVGEEAGRGSGMERYHVTQAEVGTEVDVVVKAWQLVTEAMYNLVDLDRANRKFGVG